MARETMAQMAERQARQEEALRATIERMVEDRLEYRASIARLNDRLDEVAEKVAAQTQIVQSAVDQIVGGKRVLHVLYVVGGILGGLTLWASSSGLLKYAAALPR